MESRGIVTDFVSSNFFDRGSRLYRFLNVIITHYDDMINKFKTKHNLKEKDVMFIFKGGNILRIIAKDFFLDLPSNTSRNILNFYEPYFKRSDLDFSVLLNPAVPNFDQYFSELVELMYNEQLKIKKILLEDEMRYFDFFCYNDKHKKVLFSELTKKLEVKNVSIGTDYYKEGIKYKSSDDIIFNTENGAMIRKSINKNNSYLFTSINDTFDDTTSSGWRTKFTLVRTKVRFATVDDKNKTKNIDGELIDVTIQNKESSEVESFYKEIDKNVARYTMKHKNESILFYSYSVEYLIKDIEKILFLQNEHPWADEKYAKRLNRLLFLYFIELFIKTDDRIGVLVELYRFINDGKKANIPSTLSLNKFIFYINRVANSNMNAEDLQKFEELKNVVRSNISFLIEALENVKTYCKTDGNIDVADITSTSMSEYI